MKKFLLLVIVAVTLGSCYSEKQNYYTHYPGRASRKANTQDCGSSIILKPKYRN